MQPPAPDLFGHRRHWAHKFGPAPFLPMSRGEMDLLGWDSCDIIIVTGDAYVENQDAFATVGFYMAPSGTSAWTGNLLGDWLFPGEVTYVGSFVEDYYDADADQEDGATIQFDAEPIYAGESTTFVVF